MASWIVPILLILFGSGLPGMLDKHRMNLGPRPTEIYLHYCPVHPTRWAETIFWSDGTRTSAMLSWDFHKRNANHIGLGKWKWPDDKKTKEEKEGSKTKQGSYEEASIQQ